MNLRVPEGAVVDLRVECVEPKESGELGDAVERREPLMPWARQAATRGWKVADRTLQTTPSDRVLVSISRGSVGGSAFSGRPEGVDEGPCRDGMDLYRGAHSFLAAIRLVTRATVAQSSRTE